MADLVTHLCSALFLGAFWTGRGIGLVAIGAALPDLASRGPSLGLEQLALRGWDLPDWVYLPWGILHDPPGAVPLLVVIGAAFAPEERSEATRCLLLGACLHWALDLLQDHHGLGYYLAYPVSRARFELGWIGSEATVPWAPWFAAATLAVWCVRWARPHLRKGSNTDR